MSKRACAMKQKRKHHHMDCAYSNGGPAQDCDCDDLMPCCGKYPDVCPCYSDNSIQALTPRNRCDCGYGQYYCTGACEETI